MASITNVLGLVKNIRGPSSAKNEPLPWSKAELQSALMQEILDFQTLQSWHNRQMAWIRGYTKNPALDQLANTVGNHLLSTIRRIHHLRCWASGATELHQGATSERHIVILALGDLIQAFNSFIIVRMDTSLDTGLVFEMVLVYLRKTFDILIAVGYLLYPRKEDGEWLEYLKEANEQSELRDFRFDLPTDYKRILDPTLTGVIEDAAELPEFFLPDCPAPPALLRNPGPYGPTILENARRQQ